MGKIFVIMGKSATGKDTIYKKILDEKSLGLEEITGYTTRPMREGETDGKEYRFVSVERFRELEASGALVEARCYNTVHGDWFYFTAHDENIRLDEKNYIYIITLAGYEKLKNFYGEDCVVPVYIEVEDRERILRAIERESRQQKPNYKEVCRRYVADEEDFEEAELVRLNITKRYNNRDCDECVKEIVSNIREIIKNTKIK